MRGRLQIKIGGVKRMLKFNLATMYRYDQEVGEDGAFIRVLTTSPLTAMLKMTKHALQWEGNQNDLPEPLTDDIVADWIDELPKSDLERITKAMSETVKKYGDAIAGATEPAPAPKMERIA